VKSVVKNSGTGLLSHAITGQTRANIGNAVEDLRRWASRLRVTDRAGGFYSRVPEFRNSDLCVLCVSVAVRGSRQTGPALGVPSIAQRAKEGDRGLPIRVSSRPSQFKSKRQNFSRGFRRFSGFGILQVSGSIRALLRVIRGKIPARSVFNTSAPSAASCEFLPSRIFAFFAVQSYLLLSIPNPCLSVSIRG